MIALPISASAVSSSVLPPAIAVLHTGVGAGEKRKDSTPKVPISDDSPSLIESVIQQSKLQTSCIHWFEVSCLSFDSDIYFLTVLFM